MDLATSRTARACGIRAAAEELVPAHLAVSMAAEIHADFHLADNPAWADGVVADSAAVLAAAVDVYPA